LRSTPPDRSPALVPSVKDSGPRSRPVIEERIAIDRREIDALPPLPEEILYRGFLIERLVIVFGGAKGAAVYAVLVQTLIFGSVHFQWGLGGIFVTAIMGAVWGFACLLCGRNLWIVILAHSMAHIALVTQLYFSPPA
jgi:membrane protease YdiL (CAAX protease family)